MSIRASKVPDAWPRGMQLEVVAAYVGLSPSDWLTLVKREEAPKAIEIAKDRGVWYREDVDAWMDGRRERGRPSKINYALSPLLQVPDPERPLTLSELAERWECSEQHIRDLIKAGKLKCFRVGRLIRITVAAVEEAEAVRR